MYSALGCFKALIAILFYITLHYILYITRVLQGGKMHFRANGCFVIDIQKEECVRVRGWGVERIWDNMAGLSPL